MSRYDEDIYENPFFRALKQKNDDLFESAADKRWLVCIPRAAASSRLSKSRVDFENHIIRVNDDGTSELQQRDGDEMSRIFKTVSSKDVTIRGDKIITGSGFKEVREVRILFEETFYNSIDESFRVLCLDQPLEGGTHVEEYPLPSLDTLKDCLEFLWSDPGNKRAQKTVDEVLDLLNRSFKALHGQSLRHIIDTTNATYTRAMQTVLKDSNLKKPARNNKMYMEHVKIAMESYVMAKLHPELFSTVCALYSSQDAAINKMTRNLLDLQLRDLGLRSEVYQNLPKGRDQLSKLNKFKTPMGKLGCLKKTVLLISTPADGRKEVLTADDLLPMLIFLVVKSEVPNWLGNIHYMQNFRLSGSQSGESKYFLSSIEAAVEHIKAGHVNKVKGSVRQNLLDTKRTVPWQRLESSDGDQEGLSPVDRFFACVAEDLREEVLQMLQASDPSQQADFIAQLCHPLCSCDNCEKLVAEKRNDPSTVTVFSRDYKGCTALHVASEQGLVDMMHTLITNGSVVNAADFLGSTSLHFASQRGRQSALILLMENGADINVVDNSGNTPLHLCCANGHDECVKPFFFHRHQKVDVNAPNDNGDTALHNAAKWGYETIVLLLLENGASPLARNKKKHLPVDCSLNSKVVDHLKEAAAKNDVTAFTENDVADGFVAISSDKEGVTARIDVPRAAKKQRPTDVKIAADSTPSSLDFESLPRPRGASFDRHQQEVQSFVQAAAECDFPMMRYKLGLGSAENAAEKKPAKLCHPLCQCEKCVLIKETSSSSRVFVNEANALGQTALHVAAQRGHRSVVEFLLDQDASVNAENRLRQTPLHLACQYNHQNIVMLLIDSHAKVNARDAKGDTPLHFCCSNGHDASAAILLFHGANVNAANGRGNTPLHNAAKWGHSSLVSTLFHHGSFPNVKNDNQLTPAQQTQDDNCIELFEKADRGLIQVGIYAKDRSRLHTTTREDARSKSETRDSPGLAQSSEKLVGSTKSIPSALADSPVKQIISAISDCDSSGRPRSSSRFG